MDKIELTVSSLGIIFFLALIIYSATSSGFTMFLHLFLLISGFLISILMINKVTKSSNSLKSKIYFSFALSFLVFFSIIFFWFLGNHSSIDEKRLTTVLIVMPTTTFFGVVSFIVGIILSIKRKIRKDFDYNLKRLLWIFSILSLILLILFFYNSTIVGLATSTNSKNLCYLTISPDINSPLFNIIIKNNCILKTSIEESKTGDISCGEIKKIADKNACYRWTSINKKDIKICIDNVDTEYTPYSYCETAIGNLEEEIYNILSNPSHPDIIYAIKSTPSLGIYYDKSAENKLIPLIKNIVGQSSLDAKKESLEILFTWASKNSFEEEKEVLRNEILPLIENQPELQEDVDKINARLSAVVIKSSISTVKTE